MRVSYELPGPDAEPGVLVGVDGSDGGLWALERGCVEAAAHRLPLYVLAVVNSRAQNGDPALADVLEESTGLLLASMADVVRRGVTAVRARTGHTGPDSVHVVAGHPVDLLLRVAEHQHTLVLGARGNGGFSRQLLGSVATALVHHASCPLLLVPGPPPGWDQSAPADPAH